jgi:transcription initiation factor IIE alpha subunit
MTMLEPIAPEESRLVFGNSYMYCVMVEIAGLRGEKFSSKAITDATGLSPGIVHPLIQKLRRANFIEFVERVPGERTILYRVRENPWWNAASQYVEEDRATERSAS